MRPRNRCSGCRAGDASKPPGRLCCKIKNCAEALKHTPTSCAGCAGRPCQTLKNLDQRYRAKYGCSPAANLDTVAAQGIPQLLQQEAARWKCPACGGQLCMHKPQCLACGRAWRA